MVGGNWRHTPDSSIHDSLRSPHQNKICLAWFLESAGYLINKAHTNKQTNTQKTKMPRVYLPSTANDSGCTK